MKTAYAVGDRCWILLEGREGLWPATVVLAFSIRTQPTEFYVCEVHDREWTYLEVRDALTMAEDPDARVPRFHAVRSYPLPTPRDGGEPPQSSRH